MAEPAAASPAWTARGAWHEVARPGRAGNPAGVAGVVATLREGLRLATVILGGAGRKGVREEDGVSYVWSGPDQCLALSTRSDLAAHLASVFGEGAAISDQTGARAIVALSGRDVRRALAKGVMVDLHPAAFPAGSAIVTTIAYVGVQLWLDSDGETFWLAVPASYAGSFWSWLDASAAEFGLETR